MYNEKVLNSVQTWLPDFSAMYHYTKFGMASIRMENEREEQHIAQYLLVGVNRLHTGVCKEMVKANFDNYCIM